MDAPPLLTLTIDGREVSVAPGTSLLDAARQAGIDIPNLCAHPTLKPFGRCRLCVVEVEGLRGYPSACTTPAGAGMVVVTESPRLAELRAGALELVLTEHPTGCLMCGHSDECIDHHGCHARRSGVVTGCRFCPKDQQCELQDMVERLGVHDMTLPVRYRGLPVDRRDPFFDRDYNLCILCARCVRVCDEVRGAGAVALTYRGSDALVGTAYNRRLIETECQFCGACVDVCPTGSLAERVNKWVGTADRVVATTCPYCALGCQVELRLREGQLIGVRPADHAPLCSKGRFAAVEHTMPAGRLLEPMIRRGERLVTCDWETALDRAAEALRAGARVQASRDLTSEELVGVKALAEGVLAVPAVECDAWLDGPLGFAEATLDDLAAADLVVTVRAELRYAGTPVLLAVQRAVAAGGRLIAVEPFAGDLDHLAAELHRPLPGDEASVFDGLAPALAAATRPVVVYGAALAHQHDGATVACLLALAAEHGAALLPLLDGANTRGALELGFAAPPREPAAVGAVLSFGPPPGGRPAGDVWILHTDRLDDVAATADILLPATLFGEVDGHFVDAFGRERAVARAVDPPGDARAATQVCEALAQRLGAAGLPPAAARREVASPRPERRAVPVVASPAGGQIRLLVEFSRYNHRGLPLAERVPGFLPLAGDHTVRVNPRWAGNLELRGGDTVALDTPAATFLATVRLDAAVPPGCGRLVLPPAHDDLADGTGRAGFAGANPTVADVRRVDAEAFVAGVELEGQAAHV